MATSGTFDWAPAADELLTEAWERCGKSPANLTGDVARSARASIRGLLDEWTNRRLNLWQATTLTLPLVAGTNSYALPPKVQDVLDATVAIAGSGRVLAPIGRSDWFALPNKDTRAPPSQFWCERLRDGQTLHIYPTPAQASTLTYSAMRLPEDLSALGQHADAPRLFQDALTAGLAFRLAVKYAPDRVQLLQGLYEQALGFAMGENRYRGPIKIGIRRR